MLARKPRKTIDFDHAGVCEVILILLWLTAGAPWWMTKLVKRKILTKLGNCLQAFEFYCNFLFDGARGVSVVDTYVWLCKCAFVVMFSR